MGQLQSVVKICTNALSLLGQEAITALTDGTVRATLCNNHIDAARDQALEDMKPNFAKRAVSLAAISPAPTIKWTASFQLPPDYITMVEVFPERTDFEIIGDALHTDEGAIDIIYIKREPDPLRWTPLFADAVMYQLAMRLAPNLKVKLDQVQVWSEAYKQVLHMAKVRDAQEEASKPIEADDLWRVRFVTGGRTSRDGDEFVA